MSPDTGAEYSSILDQRAFSRGLTPQTSTGTLVQLPSGQLITSPGIARVLHEFVGEEAITEIDCLVIATDTAKFMLSAHFLRAPDTLIKYMYHIKSTSRESTSRFWAHLKGNERQRVLGSFNRMPALAPSRRWL